MQLLEFCFKAGAHVCTCNDWHLTGIHGANCIGRTLTERLGCTGLLADSILMTGCVDLLPEKLLRSTVFIVLLAGLSGLVCTGVLLAVLLGAVV